MPYEFHEEVDSWSIPVVEVPEASQPAAPHGSWLPAWVTEAGIFIGVVLVFVVATVAVLSRGQVRDSVEVPTLPRIEPVASLPEPKGESALPLVTATSPKLGPVLNPALGLG